MALRSLVEQGLASGGARGIEIMDMSGATLASAGAIGVGSDALSQPILLEQTVAGYVRVAPPPRAGHPYRLWLAWLLAAIAALLLGLLATRRRTAPAPPPPPPKRFAAVLNLLNHTEIAEREALEAHWSRDVAAVAAIADARWQALSAGGYYLEFVGVSGEEALCLTLTALRLCTRSATSPARWRGALLEPGGEAAQRGMLYAALADDLSVTMTAAIAAELPPDEAILTAAESPVLEGFGERLWRLVEAGPATQGQVAELTASLATG